MYIFIINFCTVMVWYIYTKKEKENIFCEVALKVYLLLILICFWRQLLYFFLLIICISFMVQYWFTWGIIITLNFFKTSMAPSPKIYLLFFLHFVIRIVMWFYSYILLWLLNLKLKSYFIVMKYSKIPI